MKKKILIGYYNKNNSKNSIDKILYNFFNEKNKYDIIRINLSDYLNSLGIINNKIEKLLLLNNNQTKKINIDSNKLYKDIKNLNPDLIISTNYIFSQICKDNFNTTLISIINNDIWLKQWIKSKSDYYFVNNNKTKKILLKKNVNKKKILNFGILINKENITTDESKEIILKKYSLNNSLPIYLFFTGEKNENDFAFDYLKNLTKKELPIFIIFLTGNDKSLKNKAENYIFKNNIKNVLVLGYIKNISDIFSISNIIITKPGNNILNECLFLKKPSILIKGKNSEEKSNMKFMIKNHYSIKANKNISKTVSLFLNYPFILNSIQNKLNRLNNNNSLEDIYNFINKKLR